MKMLVKKMLAGANEDAGKKRCWLSLHHDDQSNFAHTSPRR